MDLMIPLGQNNTLAEYMILSGADNRPPMLDKDLYDSWKSIMELYMQNREHGIMILESVENELPKIYGKEFNYGCKLINDMNIYNMKMEQFQVNTKFLNSLSPEWSLAVMVFSPGDDPIACLNKAIAFLTAVASTRECTQPKQPRNAAWYKDKVMLAEAQEAGQILDEEQLTEDLDTYDSDCDDISNAKAVLMANISNYGSDVISETLQAYYDDVGISHQTLVARTLQQNGVVERRNRTLVEAVRTMLIFSKAPLFLWAKAVVTTCFTQNRSLIRRRHNKTPYELIHDRKPDLTYFLIFGALGYPKNNDEHPSKLKPKANIRIFVGYAPVKKSYRIYNRRIRMIMETIHVEFDELKAMAFEHSFRTRASTYDS
nr:retrovirus-related Pol polyprotein from transposon TNT 1-94 [Tanacetum cinerariifolium]